MGVIERIYENADIEIVAIFVVLYCLCGLLLFQLFNITLRKLKIRGDSYYGVTIIGTVISLNAVLLIFVLIQSFSTIQQINNVVRKELESLYVLEKALVPMPSQSLQQIKPYLVDYLTSVVSREWKLMSTKERDDVTERLFDELLSSIKYFTPQNQSEAELKEEFKPIMKDMIEARYDRVRYRGKTLPVMFFTSVFFLQILLVLHFFLLTNKTAFSQIILTIHMATLGTLFGLVVVYDHPFEGRSGIHASEFSPIMSRLDDIIGGEYRQ